MSEIHKIVEAVIKDIIDTIINLEKSEKNVLSLNRHFLTYPDLNNEHSSYLERCRICYDTGHIIPIIHPCNCKFYLHAGKKCKINLVYIKNNFKLPYLNCFLNNIVRIKRYKQMFDLQTKLKGTIGAVHLICLERWLEESNSNNCELCGYTFSVLRVPKYNAFKSVWVWLHSNEEEYRTQVRSLRNDMIRCLIITPFTIFCSYICIIAAESYALAYRNGYIMVFILIISYIIWIYLTTQYHHRIWLHWWKKKNIVKILLPENKNSEEA